MDNQPALENNLTKKTTNQEKPTDTGFDEFWIHYPKKLSKAQALRAWKLAIKRKPAGEITELAKAYANGKLPGPQYIPLASTWLNNDRWDDVEVQENKPSSKPIFGRIK